MRRLPEFRSPSVKPWSDELDVRFECRNLTEDGSFEGYGSVFNVIEESYGTRFAPGAFGASLTARKKSGDMPKLLWQHDSAQPIGVYTSISEDQRGLVVKGKLIRSVPQAQIAYDLLTAGAIDGLSVGFVTQASEFDPLTGIRTITEADLWEVSIVTFAANPAARVDNVRAADRIHTERDLERFLREEGGFSNSRAKAIASRGFRSVVSSRDEDDGDLTALADSLRALQTTLS
ncbi:HK97 family phage prohead protease [Gluconobacter cerinus]|uniref:HK97 family phage prohead protease n=1 Tax=Gluconobacter cerinus TaxID=38307 RepID=UPI001B8C4399|nr:HK97 family phage prohead protease [Gluconobacter cerinus]MBS1035385.1 HK97 family phage prohead protease [Gluconobacter cerinus]